MNCFRLEGLLVREGWADLFRKDKDYPCYGGVEQEKNLLSCLQKGKENRKGKEQKTPRSGGGCGAGKWRGVQE